MDEMKPILHINAGVGWSAIKPLCHTFQKNGYCHRGETTESNLLYYLYESIYKPDHAKYFWNTVHKHRGLDFVKENITLEWYIEYMKSRIKEGYKGVSDFSNSNATLSSQFIKEIAPSLQKEFDVRVTMIWRHPVRRSYSNISNWYKNMTDNDNVHLSWKIRDTETAKYWQHIKEKYPDSISYWKSQISQHSPFFIPDYVSTYESWSVFDNVYAIIMEEVWEDSTALSNFIGHKIDKMEVNAYYPEKGTNAPKIKGLEHQWQSDMQDLSSDDLKEGRQKLDWLYKNFYKKFGYIPYQWESL